MTVDTYAAASWPPPLEKLIVTFKLLEGYPVPPLYNIMLASDPFDNDAVAIEPEPPPVKDAVKSGSRFVLSPCYYDNDKKKFIT